MKKHIENPKGGAQVERPSFFYSIDPSARWGVNSSCAKTDNESRIFFCNRSNLAHLNKVGH